MRTEITAASLLFAAIVGACQAFTGTGDLEVRESAAASGGGAGGPSSSASVAGPGGGGGMGGAGGSADGPGPTSSAGSSMMQSSEAASSSTGPNCLSCVEALEQTGDVSTICTNRGQTAYITLDQCVCGNGGFGKCYDGTDVYGCVQHCGFGGGIPASADCVACAMNLCANEYDACMNAN